MSASSPINAVGGVGGGGGAIAMARRRKKRTDGRRTEVRFVVESRLQNEGGATLSLLLFCSPIITAAII